MTSLGVRVGHVFVNRQHRSCLSTAKWCQASHMIFGRRNSINCWEVVGSYTWFTWERWWGFFFFYKKGFLCLWYLFSTLQSQSFLFFFNTILSFLDRKFGGSIFDMVSGRLISASAPSRYFTSILQAQREAVLQKHKHNNCVQAPCTVALKMIESPLQFYIPF